MKYNPMGINREKHKKSCGYSLELSSIESKNLVVFWRQICDNPLAAIVWAQILSKENDIVLQIIYFLYVFCVDLVISLLLCVISLLDNIHANFI